MKSETAKVSLEKTYIKDLSFEVARSATPELSVSSPKLEEEMPPQSSVEFETKVNKLDDENYESSISASVKALNADGEVVYIAEVTQAGIFRKVGEIDEEILRRIMLGDCPAILFPYLREALDSMIVKGGFPPLLIAPLDFRASYDSLAEINSSPE
ncbi:MAG: protein-export chaperone SecB [Gammaproteobacteria bacterium]|nr:protein-export chaperone SecB [Gammaproteobacteria bacterium]